MATKEKFEEANRLYETANADQRYVLESLFPELRESEDERIRKALIDFLEYYRLNNVLDSKTIFLLTDSVAWLERQAQKPNPVLGIEIPFGAKDSELQEASYHIPEGFYAEIEGNRVVIKQGEQKPVAWSEEDKRKIDRIYSILRQASDTHAFSTSCRLIGDKECIELQDFLKSLKDKCIWKPSDLQIECLSDAIKHYNSLGSPASKLKELLEDLKKLREE